jgi:hypothetical protein
VQYDVNSATVNSWPLNTLIHSSLHVPNGVRSPSLATKDHNPNVAGEVIDEQQEVASSSRCSRYHRATQVPMHKLEQLLGLLARLLGERGAASISSTRRRHITGPRGQSSVGLVSSPCHLAASGPQSEAARSACATAMPHCPNE